jgi:hypothetical protein
LVGAGSNTCVNDGEAPSVTEVTPFNDSRFNLNETYYSFSVTDNADETLDCSYSLNSANVSVGVVNHGITHMSSFILISEDWYTIYYYCTDEAGNTGYSNELMFLFDQGLPEFSNFNYEDITPTVDDTLIDGDLVRVYADWTDNFELDYSELLSDIPGPGWTVEQTIYHTGVSVNQSSFVFDTTGHGGESIQFRIRTYDTAGNMQVTGPISVNVLIPSNAINLSLRESGGSVPNRLEFKGDGQSASNVQAVDTGSTALLGDFYLKHAGLGTTINNTFSLNTALPIGIQIKISGDNNPSNAVYLTTAPSTMPFCTNMIPDDDCEVWVWMDLAEAVPPGLTLDWIEVESQTI